MRKVTFAICGLVLVLLAGCESAEEKQAAAVNEELRRTMTIEDQPFPKPRPKDKSHW